ncbi:MULTISPECIES: O-antigen ligase family protein [Providencia]|uniref:O-antigen ligase family protein n=1 Tax=Providencia TaxID=586 RepID=UPI001E45A98B|nr:MULTISPECIES: O-antigen ligase family protein [Providencia]WEB84318.1 O-antigen ligase family protein [Providencia rettgeri]
MKKFFLESKKIQQSIHKYSPTIIFILCIISIILLPYKPNITSKIFNLTGIISIIIALIYPKYYLRSNILIISVPLFLIGLSNLAWVELYKTDDSIYKNVYYGYFQMGKIAIFCSFILLFTNKQKKSIIINKLYVFSAFIIQIGIFSYAIYQAFYLHYPRVELSFSNASNATGAAYSIIFLSIYTQAVFLQSKLKFNYSFYFLSLVLTYLIIILTETRAGILLYPFVSILIFILYSNKVKTVNKKKFVLPFLIILSCILVFKDTISSRMTQASHEIVLYIEEGKKSSVGDRLAMIKAGIYSSSDNLFWQSAEERNSKIITLAKADKSLQGARNHFHAHLHNDLIETLSTKGWVNGILLTLAFYFAIIFYALKYSKNPFLLGFSISLIILGFSDTLIISTQVSLSWCLALILILSYQYNQQTAINET